jgi:uncharacterized protein (TIRG00374 family)
MNWKYWIGIVVSAVFLFLAFRKVNLSELKLALEGAQYAYLIPSVVLMIVSIWIRALRWRYLLNPVKRIGIMNLYHATAIGLMGNNVLPARIGELMRAQVIGQKEKISRSASFATIVVERTFDGFTVLLFLAVILVAESTHFPSWLRNASTVAVVFYVVALAFLILFAAKTTAVVNAIEALSRPFPERFRRLLLHALTSFATGLGILRSRRDMLMSALLSPLVWLPSVAMLYLLFISFGIHLPVFVSFLLLVALCFGVMIPSAPGFIGTVQFVSVAVLALFGVPKSQALSFSLVSNATTFIPVTAAGLVSLFIGKVSFAEMRIVAKQKE